ncbi:alpha/beta hydrolase family protein [Nonlabens xiamenensis]|uniref:alpha/beta hydrolase family protein n=1 Tax=Nonlabens xiamenensis TaxID=2341043 RepID=UPI000F60F55E|nr:alpha/beta fold hydrolase [Nonlabens xiamenensis]
MITTEQAIVKGESGREMPVDVMYGQLSDAMPTILFCHGYKGFKDWGAWNLMGHAFAKAGYLFIKFNYSHNGGTVDEPIDFPDLRAFGQNNYSMEVKDTERMLEWISSSDHQFDPGKICLVGHSRAGGITTIVAAKDSRVDQLITLAGVADYAPRFPQGQDLEQWKSQGVYYVKNGRTGQEMPHEYQFFEDFQENRQELNILRQAAHLKIPHLIFHGMDDETVDVSEAYLLHSNSPQSQLSLMRRAGHTFGASHPWDQSLMPEALRQVVQCSINFMKS